jgi:hypothetical protein
MRRNPLHGYIVRACWELKRKFRVQALHSGILHKFGQPSDVEMRSRFDRHEGELMNRLPALFFACLVLAASLHAASVVISNDEWLFNNAVFNVSTNDLQLANHPEQPPGCTYLY